jgi:hypothetical protein
MFAGFSRAIRGAFDPNGECRVSSAMALWFRKGGRAGKAHFSVHAIINRKFTSNQIIRLFSEFSANLPQCRHFRFIDGC